MSQGNGSRAGRRLRPRQEGGTHSGNERVRRRCTDHDRARRRDFPAASFIVRAARLGRCDGQPAPVPAGLRTGRFARPPGPRRKPDCSGTKPIMVLTAIRGCGWRRRSKSDSRCPPSLYIPAGNSIRSTSRTPSRRSGCMTYRSKPGTTMRSCKPASREPHQSGHRCPAWSSPVNVEASSTLIDQAANAGIKTSRTTTSRAARTSLIIGWHATTSSSATHRGRSDQRRPKGQLRDL